MARLNKVQVEIDMRIFYYIISNYNERSDE
jgi:hypothetical protein